MALSPAMQASLMNAVAANSGGVLNGGNGVGGPATAAPKPAVLGAATVAPGAAGTTTPGNGTASSAADNAMVQGAQQEYGSSIAGAQALLTQNQANLPIQEAGINNTAATNANEINANAAGSLGTLGTQSSGVQSQQKLSLAELSDQIRGQNQALINSLGAAGAGSSSAVGEGQTALARVQNADRANINEQAGTNLSTIQSEQNAVSSDQKAQLDALEAWKQSQINSILSNYSQIQTQLQQQIGQAQGEEKLRLAEFGVLIQTTASQALQDLQAQITQQVQGITGAQQTIAGQLNASTTNAPTVTAAPAFQAPAAVTVPTVSPFTSSATSGNATAAPAGGSIAALMGQFQNNNVSPVPA